MKFEYCGMEQCPTMARFDCGADPVNDSLTFVLSEDAYTVEAVKRLIDNLNSLIEKRTSHRHARAWPFPVFTDPPVENQQPAPATDARFEQGRVTITSERYSELRKMELRCQAIDVALTALKNAANL